jgi:hypothetical protein
MTTALTITAGNDVTFTTEIYDAVTKVLADPDTVDFSYAVNDGTPTVTSYPSEDVITRVGEGIYNCKVTTLGMAPTGTVVTLTGQWDTQGGYDLNGALDVLVEAPELPSPFG